MDRGEDLIFGSVFFLFGLCVAVFLGRVPGVLVGGVLAVIALVTLGPGTARVAVLALVCVVGLVITVHAGATPELIMADLADFRTADSLVGLFSMSGQHGALRVGFGLVGAGLCGLVVAILSAGDDGAA